MRSFALSDGLLLDPAYTGKALTGLVSEIKAGTIPDGARVLFFATGGAFGLFAHHHSAFIPAYDDN